MHVANPLSRPARYARAWVACAAALLGAGLPGIASATLPAEVDATEVNVKLGPPSKHWVWVNDFVFPHMADGMVHLVDGDSGKYLGLLSTGYSYGHMLLPRDSKVIYSPETYFSRGTRGTRTDVITIYDGTTLNVVGEIAIPAKRASNLGVPGDATLTDDDRFLLLYNFNPSQSITVVDTVSRTFVGEIETPGCAFAFPTGPRSFYSICADGALLSVELDNSGHVAGTPHRSAPLFDVDHDPVTEKPVRVGDTWYFVTFAGRIVPVKATPKGATAGESWWLTTEAERKLGWRPGGLQQLAVHAGTHRLYSIMHRGGPETHKDPGKDIWVYDLTTHARVQKIAARTITSSIQVTTDDHPLMFAIFMDSNVLDVYDAISGKVLRSVDQVGTSPTVMYTP